LELRPEKEYFIVKIEEAGKADCNAYGSNSG
jgi:hypothetical protein